MISDGVVYIDFFIFMMIYLNDIKKRYLIDLLVFVSSIHKRKYHLLSPFVLDSRLWVKLLFGNISNLLTVNSIKSKNHSKKYIQTKKIGMFF